MQTKPLLHPAQNEKREGEVLQLLQDMTHNTGDKMDKRFKSWINLIVHDINERMHGCWWLKHVHFFTVKAGQDVIDIDGDFDRVVSLHGYRRIDQIDLSKLVSIRAQAQETDRVRHNRTGYGFYGNAGDVENYAIEAGRRLHLWPAPDREMTIGLIYMRPPALPLMPTDYWNMVVYNGVLSEFYINFDRDGLVANPSHLHNKYKKSIKVGCHQDHDVVTHRIDGLIEEACYKQSNIDSNDGKKTTIVAPASLSGIGYMTIDTGHYKFTVNEDN